MKGRLKLLLGAAAVLLTACSMIPLPGEAVAHKVSIEGEVFNIRQLTESTWTASSTHAMKPLAGTPGNTALLLQAIEKTSGCKVTDSDFSRQGKQLDAQVDCASRLSD